VSPIYRDLTQTRNRVGNEHPRFVIVCYWRTMLTVVVPGLYFVSFIEHRKISLQ